MKIRGNKKVFTCNVIIDRGEKEKSSFWIIIVF
jgi:hypothetical protein